MANRIVEQKLVDTNKKTVVKYVIVADGSTQESNTRLLDASSLAFALNANGIISQTDMKSNYRTSIKKVKAFGKLAGTIRLKWEGDSNSEIIVFGSGGIDYGAEGEGVLINNPEANATGDILISTVGMGTGDAITMFLELKKDNADYDAGQTADPYAFNRA
jgi:hypothetical protein